MSTSSPQPGTLFVIAAPSGAGKTTLVHALMQRNPELRFSISYTTRAQRRTETDGKDYHFVDAPTFETMIAAGEFLEYARVFDNYYGTARAQVEGMLLDGHSVILEIDWQGAAQVRAKMPECCSVFVLPPSLAELKRRLTGRGTDTDAVIERRFRDALSDMSHWHEFDYAIINDELETAVRQLSEVVRNAPAAAASRSADAALQRRIAAILASS